LGSAGALSLDPVQPQGALVVVAHPGDRLRTGEAELASSADGVAVVRAPSGRVEVEIEGSGRRATLVAAVSTDHVTWVRAPDPEPLTVGFAVGSARLDPSGAERLRAFAAAAGDAAFEVVGGASPEGDADANAALARERASVCAATLRSAGIADARLTTRDLPQISEPTSDPADARACIVIPRAPKGRR
jgi:outer membrane protein OmpA-like peptidoglycan-associated protein